MNIIPILPHLQAGLNVTTVCLISLAYYNIRQGNRVQHKKFMIAALVVSVLFMVSYLIYHGQVGNVKFAGEGGVRPIYFVILASHVILAALIVPMVIASAFHALRDSFERHKRIARWTFPLWIYVSVSGVVVYLMAFHLYPARVALT